MYTHMMHCSKLLTRCFRVMPLEYNPYTKHLPVTEEQKTKDAKLNVWDRQFDYSKYVIHTDPPKKSSSMCCVDVELFPRLKLMKLYYLTLRELKDMPDSYCT